MIKQRWTWFNYTLHFSLAVLLRDSHFKKRGGFELLNLLALQIFYLMLNLLFLKWRISNPRWIVKGFLAEIVSWFDINPRIACLCFRWQRLLLGLLNLRKMRWLIFLLFQFLAILPATLDSPPGNDPDRRRPYNNRHSDARHTVHSLLAQSKNLELLISTSLLAVRHENLVLRLLCRHDHVPCLGGLDLRDELRLDL